MTLNFRDKPRSPFYLSLFFNYRVFSLEFPSFFFFSSFRFRNLLVLFIKATLILILFPRKCKFQKCMRI